MLTKVSIKLNATEQPHFAI